MVASIARRSVAPPLAALPAIRRGSRIPVREGLEEVPALQGSQAALDRALRRLSFLPRTAQIGVRSVTRRGRRSLTTVAQIALAVGTLLAVLALINSVTTTTNAVWNQARWDVELDTAVGTQFDARADRLIRTTPGVAQAQPMLTNPSSSRARTPASTASRGSRCSRRRSPKGAGSRPPTRRHTPASP